MMMLKGLVTSLCFLPTTLVLVLGYRNEGFPCRAHFQCASGYCNSTRRCEPQRANAAACGVHEACQSGRCSGGVCQVQRQVGEGPCTEYEDCFEGYCDFETALCAELKGRQDDCVNDYECNSGRCFANPPRCEFVIYEGAICGHDSDCFGGRCKMKTQGGDNRCYPRKWNNERCNHNSDCLSLRCETQNCTEPEWLEGPCDEPSDCYSLFCNKEKGCVRTASEADSDEIEPEAPGITGSAAQSEVNGGGSVDISTGTVFVSDGGSGGDGSAAVSTMERVFMATVLGLVGAAVLKVVV